MKLSVIVPVYNVEKYLLECVNSIQTQTYKDLEIILVDDGSKDKSGEICDEIAASDPRVSVVHKQNGGLMAAWKTGVTYANGEYIGFVDSDDWIDEDMYSVLIESAEKDKADLVVCGLVKEYENGQQIYAGNIPKQGLYIGKEIEEKIYPVYFSGNNYASRGITVNKVTKLYKREILIDLLSGLSDEISIGEDLLTTFKYLIKSKRVTILGGFYPYHYRIHNQSMIKAYSDNKYEKIESLRKELINCKCDSYDFSKQINTDYIKLMLGQLDEEILFSRKNYSTLRSSIKKRFGSEAFIEILKESEYKKLPRKYRLYLLFFKFHLWDISILMRRLKRV